MPQIAKDSLMTLEAYAKQRKAFRAKVIEHKKVRTVHVGEHVTLQFEDELTIRYQVQEMLRIERIFEQEGIQEELDAYNPLIPDGGNLKATMMIEYPDPAERQRMLAKLKGVEDRAWIQVEGCKRVYAVADEDLEQAPSRGLAARADVVARHELGAALADDDAARADDLASEGFHAQPFADAVAAVANASLTFLMCHKAT